MNLTAFENFSRAYRAELLRAVRETPTDYGVPTDEIPPGFTAETVVEPFVDGVAAKMLTAISVKGVGSVNLYGSKAFARTCKTLGIKCTYKAIKEFLGQ
jgi:hypothetical protein